MYEEATPCKSLKVMRRTSFSVSDFFCENAVCAWLPLHIVASVCLFCSVYLFVICLFVLFCSVEFVLWII